MYVTVEDRFFLAQRLNLALAAKDKGLSVIVASRGGELRDKIESYGFKYVDTNNVRSDLNFFQQFAQIRRLYKIFLQEKPDIVHNISIKPVIYGSIAARLAKINKIVNLINGLGSVFTSTSKTKVIILRIIIIVLYWFALQGKNIKVIFQNPDDLKLFKKLQLVKDKQCHLILGSGVDTQRFKALEKPHQNNVPKILYCGRMLWSKGLQHLIEAVEILEASGERFELHLVGEPDPDNPESIDESILVGWQEKELITYHGFQPNVLQYIHDCDIAVLPTFLREGIPLSLIEIASCGKPIITTNVPGCREIVQENVNGILVTPKNPTLLADAIKRLLIDPELRLKMGLRGRKLVEQRFSSEIINKQTLALYD